MAALGRDFSWMAWLSLAGVLGMGWFAIQRGDLQPLRLTSDVETRAARALSVAGFDWARLEVRGDVGELHGVAPNEDARTAAHDAARRLFAPYMGVPGVFSELDNRVRVKARVAVPEPMPMRLENLPPTAAGPVDANSTPEEPIKMPPKECWEPLNAVMRSNSIRFRPRTSELPAGSRATVRRLAQAVKRCEAWRLVVEGHADLGSARTGNRRLDQKRAVAVASALLLEGVPVSRLALQTEDGRLRTPGNLSFARPTSGSGPRIEFQLVPQDAAAQ